MQYDEVRARLVWFLDIVNSHDLTIFECKLSGLHQFSNFSRLNSQLFQLLGINLAHELIGNADKIGNYLTL